MTAPRAGRALVTGGAGFIGSHVVDALAESGWEVLVVDSLDPGVYSQPPAYLRPDVTYSVADLRHWTPDERFDDVELVVHLAALGGVARAAREPANVLDANVGGTARLMEACRRWPRLRRVVLAGSFSVYGSSYTFRCPACGEERDAQRDVADLEAGDYQVRCRRCRTAARVVPITPATPPSPLETYGASKYMQELVWRGFDHCPVTILRFSSVYGDRLRLDDGEATIIAKVAGWVRAGQRPRLFEDGQQARDWVYVGDLVAAVQALAAGADAPPIVNVCSGVPTGLADACRLVGAAYGVECEPEIVGGFRPGDMRDCLGDPSDLARLIGRPPTPFAEGARLAFGRGARVPVGV